MTAHEGGRMNLTQALERAREVQEASERAYGGEWSADENHAMRAECPYGRTCEHWTVGQYQRNSRGDGGVGHGIASNVDRGTAEFIVLARNTAPDLAAFILGPVRELVEAAREVEDDASLDQRATIGGEHPYDVQAKYIEALRAALRALDETEEEG